MPCLSLFKRERPYFLNRIFKILFFSSLLAALFTIHSCSTKKNTFVTRSYHNVTSRYNGYYYASEIIKETRQRIEKAHIDDYSSILPMFIYADNKSVKNYYQELDKAIQKTSLVIKRHTITDRKENEIPGAVKWIDDNYLVLGKARFYKREFFDALVAFEYVAKTYKKDENRFRAMLWMIRTHNELLTLSQSGPLIDKLRNDKEFPKKFQQELSALAADYYIRRGDYDNAIKELTKAITLTKKRKTKARFTFILAQLHEETGNVKKASQLYSQVIRLKPAYEMVFNARMKRASLYDATAGSSKELKKQLLRMVKDDKNIEYLDQIYYALAQIEEKEKNIFGPNGAMEYLRLSVRNSTVNAKQKAIAYLKLADISFEAEEYKAAQAYYDSTMTVLPKDFPNYEAIASKKKNLTGLVQNLNTIAFEDSVQRLAKDSVLLEATIASILEQVEEEERRAQEEKFFQNNNFNQLPGTGSDAMQGASTFTLYNPAQAAFNISEFTKRWGSRPLEDNWRRGNRETPDMLSIEEDNLGGNTGPVDTLIKPVVNDRKKREYYLQNIPFTVQEMEKSNARIIEAYYNAGAIYKEQLLNNEKAAETFEELLKRFKENKHKLSTYYQLYRLYTAMGNQQKADYYKNILVNDYPSTEFARLIKNPDYAKQTEASKSEVEDAYGSVLAAFNQGRYAEVITEADAAIKKYPKNFLMPKFDFLKAMAIGKTQGVDAYVKALKEIVVKYPKDEVKPKAEEILAILSKTGTEAGNNNGQPTESNAASIYSYTPEAEHFVVIVANSKKINLGQLKTKISDFNSQFYSMATFNIGQVGFQGDNQMITIKTFENAKKAMDYFTTLRENSEVFKGITPDNFKLFVISSNNYSVLYNDKDLQKYLDFFTGSYSSDKQ